MDPISRRVYCQERRVHLTPTEFDLLAYLLTRQGKLVSYEELLYIVWGKMSNRYRSRVRVRVHHLRQKVPQESVRIETVRGRGYLLRNLKRDT
jgi:DNA-binding response OmpR family regulator